MSVQLLESFKQHIAGNAEISNSVEGLIETDEMRNPAKYPNIFMYINNQSTTAVDFGDGGWENYTVTISINGRAETPNVKQSLIDIGNLIYDYLLNNPDFTSLHYDRGQVGCISRGIPRIFDFDNRSFIYLNPTYRMVGRRLNTQG